jgi:aquaporin Z
MADSTTTLVQRLAAELFGTFVLILFGCGASTYLQGQGSAFIAPLTFGLVVVVLMIAFGRVSGAHLNPAVSIGAAISGRLSYVQALMYAGAQLVGGIVGALVLWLLLHGIDGLDAGSYMGQNFFGDQGTGYAIWAALLIEAIFTAVLVVVFLSVTDARNEHAVSAPLAVGLTIATAYFVLTPFTGGSLNPVRSIAPAIFAGSDALIQVWVFILAPLVGAVGAGLLYPLVFGQGAEPVPGSKFAFSANPRPAKPVPAYGAPAGYQQDWNQQPAAQQAPQPTQQWAQEPIIQDGWQWDHAAQEWKPLEQWQPAAPPQQEQPPAEQTVVSESTHAAAPQQSFQRPPQQYQQPPAPQQQNPQQPPQQGWGNPPQ